MKSSLLRLAMLVGVWLNHALPAADLPAPPKTEPIVPAIAWYSDVGQAFADAHEKKQRLLLFLEMPDQTWSRQLLDRFSEPEISAQLQDLVPARVDIRKESQLLDQLITRVAPDLRVFDADGKQVAHASGSIDSATLKKFLSDAKQAQPESGAPSLSMLFPSSDLDALLKIESSAQFPEGQNVVRLLELAGGKSGETRLEAQRLLKLWSRKLAPQLPAFLSSKTLKPRLAAFEALSDIEAPLENYDPWSGPAAPELIAKLTTFGAPLASIAGLETKKAGMFPPLSVRTRAQVDADLKEMRSDDTARQDAAWQRLAGGGRGIVPILREQSRALVAADPAMALRYDELRFRLLLGTDTLRKRPAAPHKLAVGNPGERASLLADILQSGAPDLDGLAREAACDRDPLFRETAIRQSAAAMDDPAELLRETLKDTDANVRVAALTVMAQSAAGGHADAIAKYLADEPDADMIGHAVRALSSVDNQSSRSALRELLKDKRWQVRASAVEALGKLKDEASAEVIAALAEGDDGFVAGQAIAALKDLNSANLNLESMMRAVKKYPSVTLTVIKTIGEGKLRKTIGADKLLREFTKNEKPEIRAQALAALASDTERPAFEEVAAGMNDPAPIVQIAAVTAMRSLIDENTIKNLHDSGKPAPAGYREVRGRLLAMLKESNDELRAETIQTLCYFGEWHMCWIQFKELLTNPHENLRLDALRTLRYFPGTQVLEAARICIADRKNLRASSEWVSLLYGISSALKDKAAIWKPDEPAVQAAFEIFTHLDADQLEGFLTRIKSAGLQDRNDYSSPADTKNRKALAATIQKWIDILPDGIHKHALRLLWLEVAELEDTKLREYLNDPDFEIRRMALALAIRAQAKGPADLIKQFLNDPAPEMRRLAIAGAIPGTWRDGIDDPTAYDIVAGHKSHAYRRYSNLDLSKVPKVVELPVESLEKLLKDDDENVRVLTAYLMALEGGDQGIPVLVNHLKSAQDSTEAAQELMRAVIMAWSDELTPQLETACKALKGNSWELRQAWPYIKLLKGTEVKKFRAKLLKETPELR